MRSTTAQEPVSTPMPVQLSAPAFDALLLPPLAMPQRGPQGKLGYARVLTLILWGLYPGRPWQGFPMAHATHGTPALQDTPSSTVFALWADAGSLWQACVASVWPLAPEQHLESRGLQGAGTNPVAPQGARAWAPRATSTQRVRMSAPASSPMGMAWLPGLQQLWGCCRRAGKP